MRRKKKEFLKSREDVKIIRTNRILRLLILCLVLVVAYDAWVHQTPLYYILFLIAGLAAGRFYHLTIHIKQEEDGRFLLFSNIWNMILTILLLLVRILFAKKIMESMQVVWVNDAIYLFLIGLYWTKWRTILNKMEDIVFGRLKEYYDE